MPEDLEELDSVKVESPQENVERLSFFLEYVSALAHLATFSIIGVLVRYGLEKLFGPSLARVTDTTSALFIDLPANMVGCFFMGWVGVVLKQHLTDVSEHLALGLSTGLMGSITTFASWSQSMLRLITAGYWTSGMVGFLLGFELAMMSLLVGIDTANLAKSCILHEPRRRSSRTSGLTRMNNLVLFMLLSVGLWMMAFTLLFWDKSRERKRLWIACTLAPLGVWSRWWLSALNGRGFRGRLVWLPMGTLCANVSASLVEFVLGMLQALNLIRNRELQVVSSGFQFGMLGCMSTVSTLVAETYRLLEDTTKWRCYAYASVTILVTLAVGLVTFSAPVWITGAAASSLF